MIAGTVLTAIAATYLFLSVFALAPRKAGYSHARHTISEIGEAGAPHQRFVALGLFLPIGVTVLVVAWLIRSQSPPAAALALCIAIGYIGAALFPCDPGSPLFGTTRQAFHNFAGAAEYAGGGFALMKLAEEFDAPFKAAGFIVLASTIGLSILPSNSIRGVIQRIAEVCLFGGLALAIWRSGVAA